ncbi:hypothetical protein M3Y97_00082700 [Aphelenchoides bicaudatus]|nr:hypothetical protein M3Y97_00082700 [Aphelenchoides bicaudatus]
MESASVEVETNIKKSESLEHAELKSCDRCFLRCSRIFWSSSTSNSDQNKPQKSPQKPIKSGDKEVGQQPDTSSGYFITAGQLLETGPCGKLVFNLSQQIAKAPSFAPKRRHQVLNQSWRAIHLIDTEIENLRAQALPLMLQKISNRQEGILQGTSEEYKNAVYKVSDKFRNRRAEINAKCSSQIDSLKKQLRADLEIEERIAKQKTNEALNKRLKDVEDKLKQLGCAGPDFTIPSTDVEIQQSNLYRIEYDNKYATSMLPLPKGLIKSVEQAEKDELQSFIVYGRMANHSENEQPEAKKFKIEQVSIGIGGLLEDLGGEESDDE